jgi:aryl-alcohol dehydrogenase-like predicted oxidoreductase
VTFFDTAQAYGFGAAEELLGEALAPDLASRREEVVLATKGGLRPEGGGVVRDSGRGWLRSGVESSLRALGVETIDLYQVHWPDPAVPFTETAETLSELVDEGKIAHVGVSNFDVEQMREFSRGYPLESLQPPYHMFRREVEEEILPHAGEHDIGVMAYGPLAHGLLTGQLDEAAEFDADDWREAHPAFAGQTYRTNLRVVDELAGVAADLGCTLSQLAIAWVLAHPAVHVAIVGSRRAAHVTEAAEAASLELPRDALDRVEAILAGAVPIGGATPEGV